jgi:hypothetical protein
LKELGGEDVTALKDPKTKDPSYCGVFYFSGSALVSSRLVSCNNTGSCYGAEDDQRRCCNSCEEVREQYRKRGWAFVAADSMEQASRAAFSACVVVADFADRRCVSSV